MAGIPAVAGAIVWLWLAVPSVYAQNQSLKKRGGWGTGGTRAKNIALCVVILVGGPLGRFIATLCYST